MLETLSILTYQSVKIVNCRQSAGNLERESPQRLHAKQPYGLMI